MLPTSGTERARYEQLLARAHQATWSIYLLLQACDEYEAGDEMREISASFGELMEQSMRVGGRLRTAPRPRA